MNYQIMIPCGFCLKSKKQKILFCNIVEFLETLIAQAIDAFILMAAHFFIFFVFMLTLILDLLA